MTRKRARLRGIGRWGVWVCTFLVLVSILVSVWVRPGAWVFAGANVLVGRSVLKKEMGTSQTAAVRVVGGQLCIRYSEFWPSGRMPVKGVDAGMFWDSLYPLMAPCKYGLVPNWGSTGTFNSYEAELNIPLIPMVVVLVFLSLWCWKLKANRWGEGCCPKCGYSVEGLDGGVCPECGNG